MTPRRAVQEGAVRAGEPAGRMPTLDVVVVAFRSGAVLRRCLAEVARFAPGARIVVVDNSPGDGSAAEAVEAVPGAVRLAQPGNVGYAAAVNRGLAHTTGDVVLVLNPDIVELRGGFADVARIFEEKPRAGAVAVRVVDEDGMLEHTRRLPRRSDVFVLGLGGPDGLVARLTGYAGQPLRAWAQDEERDVGQASGSVVFLRRAAIDDVGGFDERFFMYFEETDWLVRAAGRDWRLVFTPRIEAVHLGRRSSGEDELGVHQYLLTESAYAYVRKHYGAATTAALRLVWAAADLARLAASWHRPPAHRAAIRARLRLHLGARAAVRP